jgi:hypothetical protein
MRPRPRIVTKRGQRQQRLDERTFVVGSAAAVDVPVLDRALEWRDGPPGGARGLHVPVHHETEHRRPGGTRQLDFTHGARVAKHQAQVLDALLDPSTLLCVRVDVAGFCPEPNDLAEHRLQPRGIPLPVHPLEIGRGLRRQRGPG